MSWVIYLGLHNFLPLVWAIYNWKDWLWLIFQCTICCSSFGFFDPRWIKIWSNEINQLFFDKMWVFLTLKYRRYKVCKSSNFVLSYLSIYTQTIKYYLQEFTIFFFDVKELQEFTILMLRCMLLLNTTSILK